MAANIVMVRRAQLPLSCPNPDAEKWNHHPRVFLPLSPRQPDFVCPYCGVRYRLQDAAEGEK